MINAIGAQRMAGTVTPDPVGDKNDSGYANQQQQMVQDLRKEHADYDEVSNHEPQTYKAWVNSWKAAHGQPTSSIQPRGNEGFAANFDQQAPTHGGDDSVAFSPEALELLDA